MTPMTLDAALKVVLDRLKYPLTQEDAQIAAVLRAFKEKGLPFFKAAKAASEAGILYHDAPTMEECDRRVDPYDRAIGEMVAAYRAMKEGK